MVTRSESYNIKIKLLYLQGYINYNPGILIEIRVILKVRIRVV